MTYSGKSRILCHFPLINSYAASQIQLAETRGAFEREMKPHIDFQLSRLGKDNCTLLKLFSFSDVHDDLAILLVSSSFEYARTMLFATYLHTATKAFYCKLFHCDVLLYVHQMPLPLAVPPHFCKVSGINATLIHYKNVLFTDWDTFMSVDTAISVVHMFPDFPKASLILQYEWNLCSCVLFFRRNANSFKLLNLWWEFGKTGCCTVHTFDQIAFRHVLLSWLRNETGYEKMYDYNSPKNSEPITPITTLLPEALPLYSPAVSAIGFHGFQLPLPMVQLHSCLGFWTGCIDAKMPALLYHTGHERLYVYDHVLQVAKNWL